MQQSSCWRVSLSRASYVYSIRSVSFLNIDWHFITICSADNYEFNLSLLSIKKAPRLTPLKFCVRIILKTSNLCSFSMLSCSKLIPSLFKMMFLRRSFSSPLESSIYISFRRTGLSPSYWICRLLRELSILYCSIWRWRAAACSLRSSESCLEWCSRAILANRSSFSSSFSRHSSIWGNFLIQSFLIF